MEEQCLGIDWGAARIGLAIGNSGAKLASPLGTAASVNDITSICRKEKIERLVVGQPFSLAGREPDEDQPFGRFIEELMELSLPISLVDERLSSKAADSLDPAARKEGNRDAIAAMVILQSYFDSL